jgi:hypothetical protein
MCRPRAPLSSTLWPEDVGNTKIETDYVLFAFLAATHVLHG